MTIKTESYLSQLIEAQMEVAKSRVISIEHLTAGAKEITNGQVDSTETILENGTIREKSTS